MLPLTAVKRKPQPRYWRIGILQVRCTRYVRHSFWNICLTVYRAHLTLALGLPNLKCEMKCLSSLRIVKETNQYLFYSCPNTTDASYPWNVSCDSAELDSRLSLFSQWRGTRSNDNLGLWHLMSGCPTGSEVGIAWLASLSVYLLLTFSKFNI